MVFATSMPISNTMAEMFTMQRSLHTHTLRRNQMHHFDSWAVTLGEAVSSIEPSPYGKGYRLQTRFARFVNVPNSWASSDKWPTCTQQRCLNTKSSHAGA